MHRPHSGEAPSMPTTRSTTTERAARYRQAADQAVEMLDWTISYFHRIRKHDIARSLQRNRSRIVKGYRGY
jgi:hypothetical protein